MNGYSSRKRDQGSLFLSTGLKRFVGRTGPKSSESKPEFKVSYDLWKGHRWMDEMSEERDEKIEVSMVDVEET